jgi:hypothetical protein
MNKINVKISNTKSGIRIIRSAMIKNVLTNMPIPLENPTNPGRYSFFNGLKNVLRNRGSANS